MVNFRLDVCTSTNKVLISCVLITTGAGFLIGWSWIFNSILRFGLNLKENSYLEKLWRINPMPLNLEIYALNWTNPEDLYKPGVKPRFKQIGPLSFREIKEKGNVTWNKNNTVTFKQYHTYYFDRERSISDMNLPITTLNPVYVSAAYTAKQQKWGFWMQKGMQITFSQLKQPLIVTKSIRQFLFEGYDDPTVKLATSIPLPIIPKLPLDDKFAWFYGRNGTSFEGVFNMGTSYDNFGVLEQWNFSNKTDHYTGSCGRVTGQSAGEIHRPYPSKDSVSIFIADMCRNVPLDFEKEEYVDGVLGRKYSAGNRFLDNGTLYPENKCYCPGVCLPSGALNISSCKYGAPGFVSLPHFLNADDYYLNGVEGLQPEQDKHEFYITLEPLTGIILRVAARLQLNLYLEPSKYLSGFEKMPRMVFPVLWLQQVAQIPDFVLMLIKIVTYLPLMFQIMGALLMSVGFLILSAEAYGHINSSLKPPGRGGYPPEAAPGKNSYRAMTIREMVPLGEKDRMRVVYETDAMLLSDTCALRS